MTIPAEFREFTSLFLQGSHEWSPDEKSWIDQAVRLLDREKRSGVRQYIQDLIAGDRNEREIREIWNSCSPNYGIGDGGDVRQFLSLIQERLELAD